MIHGSRAGEEHVPHCRAAALPISLFDLSSVNTIQKIKAAELKFNKLKNDYAFKL